MRVGDLVVVTAASDVTLRRGFIAHVKTGFFGPTHVWVTTGTVGLVIEELPLDRGARRHVIVFFDALGTFFVSVSRADLRDRRAITVC